MNTNVNFGDGADWSKQLQKTTGILPAYGSFFEQISNGKCSSTISKEEGIKKIKLMINTFCVGLGVSWKKGKQVKMDVLSAYREVLKPIILYGQCSSTISKEQRIEIVGSVKKTHTDLVIFCVVDRSEGGVLDVIRPSEKGILFKTALVLDIDGTTTENLKKIKNIVEKFSGERNCSYLYAPSTTDNEEGNKRKGHLTFLLDEDNYVKTEEYKETMDALLFELFKEDYTKEQLKNEVFLDGCGDKAPQGFFKTILLENNDFEKYIKNCFFRVPTQKEEVPCLNTSKLLEDFRKDKQNNKEAVDKFFGWNVSTKSLANDVSVGVTEKEDSRGSFDVTNPFACAFRDMPLDKAIKVVESCGYVFKQNKSTDVVEFNSPGASCEGGVYLRKYEGNWSVKSFHQNSENCKDGSSLWKFFVRKVNGMDDRQFERLKESGEDWGFFYDKTISYIKENKLMKEFGLSGKILEKRYGFSKVLEKPKRISDVDDKTIKDCLGNLFGGKEVFAKLEYVVGNSEFFDGFYYDVLGNKLVKKVDGEYRNIDSYYRGEIIKKIEYFGFYYNLSCESKKCMLINDITNIIKDKGFLVNPLREKLESLLTPQKVEDYKQIKSGGGKLKVETFASEFLGCKREFADDIFLLNMIKLCQNILYPVGIDDKQRKNYTDKYIPVLLQGANKGKTTVLKELFESIGAKNYVAEGVDINKPIQKFYADTYQFLFGILDDNLYKKQEYAVSNLKNLGNGEVMVEKKFLEPIKVPYRCSFVVATDNTQIFRLNENNIRFLPLIPFEGVQGLPTTGIWAERYFNKDVRLELYRELWVEVAYLILYEQYTGFTQKSSSYQKELLSATQETIAELKNIKNIEDINIIDMDKEEKDKLIEKCVLEVKKTVAEKSWEEILTPEIRSICDKVFDASNYVVDNCVVSLVAKKCGYKRGNNTRLRGQKGISYIINYKKF